MRKFLYCLILLAFPISSFGQDDAVFKLTDGYFASSFAPVHLTHDDVKLDVRLAGQYNLWLNFKVNEKVANPCSVREDQPCRVIHLIIQKNPGEEEVYIAGQKSGLEFRADELVGFSFLTTTIPRTAPFKNVFLVARIVKNDKDIFFREWPVNVWP